MERRKAFRIEMAFARNSSKYSAVYGILRYQDEWRWDVTRSRMDFEMGASV
jgi:hypothetical protein